MANMCGFKSNHAPIYSFISHVNAGYNFFADTPCYDPHHISEWLEKWPDSKFIYINKEPHAWFKSLVKVGLLNNYHGFEKTDTNKLSTSQAYDYKIYKSSIGVGLNESNYESRFNNHRDNITQIIPSDQLLVYSFDQGWEPFCDFLQVNRPQASIPHINIDTMFDKI